jgi:hypothetical protein
MNNNAIVLSVAKGRRAELVSELDTIDKFIALMQPNGAKAKKTAAASNGAGTSSARSEAMRRAWAKRKKAAAAGPVAEKKRTPKKTVGASLADVA